VSPFGRFLVRRLLAAPFTLFIITLVLYGMTMLVTPEERAQLFWPERTRVLTDAEEQRLTEMIIKRQGLDQPFPVQYAGWIGALLSGNWGYSSALNGWVLPALLRRTPATFELTLWSALLFVPLGLVAGVLAGSRHGRRLDDRFRAAAFVATSIPPFIVALMCLAVLYVSLRWFAPERIGLGLSLELARSGFVTYTGMFTVDGLLNGRLDVVADALRHLVMPVFTLSLLHWATLARVTRAAVIDELDKEYLVAARARGLRERAVLWRHAFRNALVPALTSTALSAASLLSGVYVVELIYNFHGISELVYYAMRDAPDITLALGFAIYSVLLVLLMMLALDVAQALVDPRMREGIQT
jgi:ABC-type dipeptide/oligopeptide/nickel transport system permease component